MDLWGVGTVHTNKLETTLPVAIAYNVSIVERRLFDIATRTFYAVWHRDFAADRTLTVWHIHVIVTPIRPAITLTFNGMMQVTVHAVRCRLVEKLMALDDTLAFMGILEFTYPTSMEYLTTHT
eukprot:1866439-Heterocapsa_arctica.AAC.1